MGMTEEQWNSYRTIERVFTGPYPGDDDMENEDADVDNHDCRPNEMTKTLEIGKEDMISDESELKRRQARGKVRFDIDSVLALFTDLSIIRSVLPIYFDIS